MTPEANCVFVFSDCRHAVRIVLKQFDLGRGSKRLGIIYLQLRIAGYSGEFISSKTNRLVLHNGGLGYLLVEKIDVEPLE